MKVQELSIDNLPLDYVVIILVILAGEFQKKYLADFKSIGKLKITGAWATLLVSAVFTVAYGLLVKVAGTYDKSLPLQWFFSYVTATSLYELFLDKLLKKYLPGNNIVKLIIICTLLTPLSSQAAMPAAGISAEAATTRQLMALLLSFLLSTLVLLFGGLFIAKQIIKQQHADTLSKHR